MEIQINTANQEAYIIGATGIVGLMQEVRTLLATRKGSVPLDRDFGLDWHFIDKPMPMAMPLYVAEVARAIERYIPRLLFVRLDFEQEARQEDLLNGLLTPVVVVKIREEYLHEFDELL